MVIHTCDSCMWEAEIGGLLQVQDQSGLHNDSQVLQDYVVKPWRGSKSGTDFLNIINIVSSDEVILLRKRKISTKTSKEYYILE